MTCRLFIVVAPGLEDCLHKELTGLGLSVPPPFQNSLPASTGWETGGVELTATLSDLYRLNLHLRTASRILLRLGSFKTLSFAELRQKAARLPWKLHLQPGQPVAIRVTCHKSRLYHSDGVAERIAAAISEHMRTPTTLARFDENTPTPSALIIARLDHDICTISIDSSGAPLHHRGYRQETAKAPLRETLAAGILIASGWKGTSPLIDPFCGSGTIPIEAALLTRRIAPGKNRRFAFMQWSTFDPRLWQELTDEAAAQELPSATCPILASDRDAGGIHIAQSNASRARVSQDIIFEHRALSAIDPPAQTGWIISNPPYGKRIRSSHDLRDLYSQIGNVLRAKCPGWNVAILCNSDYLIGHTKLQLLTSLSLVNGGIPVRLYTGRVRHSHP
ncbi:MAG: class I SAM-dependent RNA methyltransferase [Anaerolineae bacterium]|nr:class I SAM-dependent RNA methyltransferase [Anaerolineae bacterium]